MKNLFKTKTFWTGAGSVVTGVGLILTGNKADGLQLLFTGFGLIFMRKAIQKNA
jgi:hypothetical protein